MASLILFKLVAFGAPTLTLSKIRSKKALQSESCNSWDGEDMRSWADSPNRRWFKSSEKENVDHAYHLAKSGRFAEAVQCFQQTVHHLPWISEYHTDLGRAMLRVAKRRLKSQGCRPVERNRTSGNEANSSWTPFRENNCTELVCQDIAEGIHAACASMRLAIVLAPDTSSERAEHCEQVLAKLPCTRGAGSEDQIDELARHLREMREAQSGRTVKSPALAEVVLRIANDVCSLESAVTISDEEVKTGLLHPQTLLAAFLRLEVCGVVELRGSLIPSDLLAALGQSQEAAPQGSDHKVAVERWQKRFEVQVPLTLPYTDHRLAANSLLLGIVRLMLGPRVEIDTFSQITALSEAPDQPWHFDVDHLFRDQVGPGSVYLPTVGLVAVVPLANISEELGPTEFMAGSHIFVGEHYWESMQDLNMSSNPSRPMPVFLKPLPALGSVVLFNLRTRHRGTRNRGLKSRSLMYISFVKDWLLDRLNFQGFQSSSFDTLEDSTMQKLLRRVDTRTYMSALESFAAGQVTMPPQPAKPFHEPDLRI